MPSDNVLIGELKVETLRSVYMECPHCGNRVPTGIIFLSHDITHKHVPLMNNISSPCPSCGNYFDVTGERECFDEKLFKRSAS